MTGDPARFAGSAVDLRCAWLVLGVAALVRLAVTPLMIVHHPDEIWQYIEPAYGLATGRSVVTWEFRAGIRTWLIPMLFAGPIGLGTRVSSNPAIYLAFGRVVAALISLGLVGFGMALAGRISRAHGLVAGLVLAGWFELIYFSGRILSEPIGAAALFAAIWCLLPGSARSSTRRVVIGGALLSLGFCIRFQLAPTLGVLFLIALVRLPRASWPALAGGLAIGLAIDGLCDAIQGAVPFRWVIENFRVNLIERKSENFGTEPPFWYCAALLRIWGWGAILILPAVVAGARRMPVAVVLALVNLAAHAMIPHKEYRFVFASEALLLLVAAAGSVDLVAWVRRRREGARWPWALLAAVWLSASVANAVSPAGSAQWKSSGTRLREHSLARSGASACGLAILHPDTDPLFAYSLYGRAVPIYALHDERDLDDLRQSAPAFDALVAWRDRAGQLGPAWSRLRCARPTAPTDIPICLYVRRGGCDPVPGAPFAINRVLAREGL